MTIQSGGERILEKKLEEMSMEELEAYKTKLKEELGDDAADQLDPPEHWLENPPALTESQTDLIEALDEMAKVTEAKRPGPKQGAPKSPPKGYPESRDKYADPENYKYPLDTEKHVRAALSYFSKKSNRSKGGYSPEEQKFMWNRILAAARKLGIELSDDVKKRAEKVQGPGGNSDNQDDGDGGEDELNEQQVNELVEKKIQELFAANGVQLKTKGKEQSDGNDDDDDGDDDDDTDFSQFTDQLEAFKKTNDQLAPMAEAFDGMDPKALAAHMKATMDAKNGYDATVKELKSSIQDLQNKLDALTPGTGKGTEATKNQGATKDEKKAKEAKAEGQVASDDQVKNKEGVKGPAAGEQPPREPPKKPGFGGVMERAGRRTR